MRNRFLLATITWALAGGCVGYIEEGSPANHEAAALVECLDETTYCMLDELGEEETEELVEGGCWITGGGHIGSADSTGGAGRHNQDSFGFNAMGMKDGRVRGELQNTTHLGDVFHGQATFIECWRDDGIGPEVPVAIPNNARWGGTGTFNREPGYTFEAHLADRAEGGSHVDEYELWIYGPTGELVYSQTAEDDRVITGGNFQIHPPNAGHPYGAGSTSRP